MGLLVGKRVGVADEEAIEVEAELVATELEQHAKTKNITNPMMDSLTSVAISPP
jgi:hypothetical protein